MTVGGASSTYDKFLPDGIPSWQMPFWESLRAHAVEVQRCDSCGRHRHIPKELCPACRAPGWSWVPIAGVGDVYTYTVVRRAPTPAYQADTPYTIVHVTMDEGFRMIGRLTAIDPEAVRIGMRVSVAYADVTPEWTLLEFKPA
jgi:uncharacterized protein